MHCPECSTQVIENAKFCHNCAYDLRVTHRQVEDDVGSNRRISGHRVGEDYIELGNVNRAKGVAVGEGNTVTSTSNIIKSRRPAGREVSLLWGAFKYSTFISCFLALLILGYRWETDRVNRIVEANSTSSAQMFIATIEAGESTSSSIVSLDNPSDERAGSEDSDLHGLALAEVTSAVALARTRTPTRISTNQPTTHTRTPTRTSTNRPTRTHTRTNTPTDTRQPTFTPMRGATSTRVTTSTIVPTRGPTTAPHIAARATPRADLRPISDNDESGYSYIAQRRDSILDVAVLVYGNIDFSDELCEFNFQKGFVGVCSRITPGTIIELPPKHVLEAIEVSQAAIESLRPSGASAGTGGSGEPQDSNGNR